MRKDYAVVRAVHTGEWLNRLTSDTSIVAGSATDILPSLLGMVVKLISAMTMIIVLEPRFALLVLAGGLVVAFFTVLFRNRLKQMHKNVQEADGHLRVFLQERLGSLMVVRSFAAESETLESAKERMAGYRKARLVRNTFSNACNILESLPL